MKGICTLGRPHNITSSSSPRWESLFSNRGWALQLRKSLELCASGDDSEGKERKAACIYWNACCVLDIAFVFIWL